MEAKAQAAAKPATVIDSTVISIDAGRVRPFADQPREYFDPSDLISLELSIKQRGQLQPGMVRQLRGDRDHDFELVDGQRRWHACIQLGIPFRAVIIEPKDDEDQYEISVAANFQRAAHTPMEIAKAIERICTQGGRTEEYVGTLFGKSGVWVNLYRRLVRLAPELQAFVDMDRHSPERLQVNVAIELARLPKDVQVETWAEIRARGLTAVRAVDKIKRLLVDESNEVERRKKPTDHGRHLQRFIRVTIQRADSTMDRMGPDDLRLLVASLTKAKKYEELRESLMTAIGRLEVLHRRLTECRAAMASQGSQTAPTPKPEPLRAKTAPAGPTLIYSHPMKCPKCNSQGTRFRRWSNANVEKEYWECTAKGCLLKISHYNIKIDRTYQPESTAASA
jgi:ParB family chromosome partitioning protein